MAYSPITVKVFFKVKIHIFSPMFTKRVSLLAHAQSNL